jgi:hypothetical protein
MYEVVTGIPAFSNFYHENMNKRYVYLYFPELLTYLDTYKSPHMAIS